jgi:hypothetical protein
MGEGELVSLNEIRDRFYEDDLELLASARALVEITVRRERGTGRKPRDPGIRLRFGRPGGALDRESPGYGYVAELDEASSRKHVQTAFGIGPGERVWSAAGRDGLTTEEAWEALMSGGGEITCVRERQVEIALYRGQDDEGGLLPNVGIQLHFGEPGRPVDEKSDAYNFPAWMDSGQIPSGRDMFTLDDIPVIFDIGPDDKVWAVGDPG